jgi:hypothetical protein
MMTMTIHKDTVIILTPLVLRQDIKDITTIRIQEYTECLIYSSPKNKDWIGWTATTYKI